MYNSFPPCGQVFALSEMPGLPQALASAGASPGLLNFRVFQSLIDHILVNEVSKYDIVFCLRVLAPMILNLMHLVIGVWVTLQRGNVISLGFSAAGFLTKSLGMVFFNLAWNRVF